MTTVLGCTGHQNIPPGAVGAIVQGLSDEIGKHAPSTLVGVCSLAVGADQLFAEAVLRHGGRLHAIIPCSGYEATFEESARERYRDLLGDAHQVEVLPHDRPSEEAFLDAGRVVAERAEILIAVWDGMTARGKGGTADVVEYARRQNCRVVIVWPPGVRR